MSDTPPPAPAAGIRPARGFFARFLGFVEWLGNLLPHPVSLFAIFCFAILIVSGLAGYFEWSVVDPRPEDHPGRDPSGRIHALSLMNKAGLQRIVTGLVTNFTGFKPLGTVLVALLGVGIAEASGLLSAAIRGLVLRAPKNLVTMAIVFAGVLSNMASEMGYVVLIPLAAVVFHGIGRHPLAGLAAAFAGVSGGYSANLVIGTVDPLLSGITEEAAQLLDPNYSVNPTINYYFMCVSTVLITLLGTFVTAYFVEPRLGKYDESKAQDGVLKTGSLQQLTDLEKKGLKHAAIAALLFIGLLALSIVPEWGVLRDPDPGRFYKSPFFTGIVAVIFLFFGGLGIVYGRVVGTIKNDRDVIDAMAKSMGTLGLYIVLVFFAAQFVSYFNWTNLGLILAVTGADILKELGLTGPSIFVPFILMCCFVNLMLGSASAQWAVTAPIFVPMLMEIGYAPEVIQAAYRIGDSTTNIISPMMSYFGLILAFATRYDKRLGIGTIVSTMLPYTIVFLLGWIALFYVFVFGLDLPVGPGSETYYPAPR